MEEKKLYVIGIGPGAREQMTVRADRILRESQVIIGYTVYVDLVKEFYPQAEFLTTPMRQEKECFIMQSSKHNYVLNASSI